MYLLSFHHCFSPPCLSCLFVCFNCGFFPKAKAFFLPFKVWSWLSAAYWGREAAWACLHVRRPRSGRAKEKKPSERSLGVFFWSPRSLLQQLAGFTGFSQWCNVSLPSPTYAGSCFLRGFRSAVAIARSSRINAFLPFGVRSFILSFCLSCFEFWCLFTYLFIYLFILSRSLPFSTVFRLFFRIPSFI